MRSFRATRRPSQQPHQRLDRGLDGGHLVGLELAQPLGQPRRAPGAHALEQPRALLGERQPDAAPVVRRRARARSGLRARAGRRSRREPGPRCPPRPPARAGSAPDSCLISQSSVTCLAVTPSVSVSFRSSRARRSSTGRSWFATASGSAITSLIINLVTSLPDRRTSELAAHRARLPRCRHVRLDRVARARLEPTTAARRARCGSLALVVSIGVIGVLLAVGADDRQRGDEQPRVRAGLRAALRADPAGRRVRERARDRPLARARGRRLRPSRRRCGDCGATSRRSA